MPTSTPAINTNGEISDAALAESIERLTCLIESGNPEGAADFVEEHPAYADTLRRLLPAIEALATLDVMSDDLGTDGTAVKGVLGDFRVKREIGRGGMGVVYEAEQISLNRRVALKMLPMAAMLDARRLERFRHEAQAAAMLRHPHIVSVYSVGCERGIHYYAMDYIEGPSLAEVVGQVKSMGQEQGARTQQRSSAIPGTLGVPQSEIETVAVLSTLRTTRPTESFRAVARLGIQAAEALDYAHQMGVVHRDIKPSNLLIDPLGKLWITDFGLAMTQTDAGLTMTGDLLGTLRYMSPEQAAGKRLPLDHRTDVYSLGITLYELLAGRPAFDTTERGHLLRAIAEVDPPPLRKLVPSIPADLATIVHKAIEKDATDRYATAQAIADDLHRFVDNRTITARRPSFVAVTRKWVRRHQAAAVVAAIAMVLLLMFTAAVVADRWRQIREATRFVETSLQAARTAFEANDIQQAAMRLSEAETRIKAARIGDSDLVNDVAALTRETERYAKFLPLLDEVRWKRTRPQGTDAPEQKALALYGVMDEGDWLATLRAAEVPEKHIKRIADDIYELLIFVADDCTRWAHKRPGSTHQEQLESASQEAAKYLNRAISFHAPSCGYYWQLANCAAAENNQEHAKKLRQIARETPVHDAAELFYINRDHWWGTVSKRRGHPEYTFEENYKAHREMLRRDPSFYHALFFTAILLGREDRLEEALVGWYGCLAVRPNDTVALANRALVHQALGHFDEALADAEHAMSVAPKLWNGYAVTAWILSTSPVDEFRDGRRALEIAKKGSELVTYQDSNEVYMLDALAAAYAEVGDFESAVKWSETALEPRFGTNAEEIRQHLESFRNSKPWREEVKHESTAASPQDEAASTPPAVTGKQR